MCQLLETIKISNGKLFNIKYHQDRINDSLKAIFNKPDLLHLDNILNTIDLPVSGLHKLRIIYDDKTYKFDISEYQIKNINSLKIIMEDDIKYDFKYANRNQIMNLFLKRENCDEILILQNGHITDTSYSNIVFKFGNDWITPHMPLLNGTKRRNLLENQIIKVDEISLDNIKKFQEARIINAMIDLDESPSINIENIKI